MATTYPNQPAAYAAAHPSTFVLYDSALLIGRIVLVLMFIYSGAGKFMDLSSTAGAIGSKGLPQPMLLATLAAAAEFIGGLLIVIGWQTRLVAFGLLIFTGVAAYFFHDFWHLPESAERMNNMIQFMKNVSLCGSFLMLIGVGAGRYSVDGRS